MSMVRLSGDANCPKIEAARKQLYQAIRQVGQPAHWREQEWRDPAASRRVQDSGSPAICVAGQDVGGSPPDGQADCSRCYPGGECGLEGNRLVDSISAPLRRSRTDHKVTSAGWSSWMAVSLAAGVALLPRLACPACWPAYAGLLSAVGLGFLMKATYLLPLTVVLLVVSVGTLSVRARKKQGYGPFRIGVVSAFVVIAGKL